MRQSLRAERWREIKRSLLNGQQHFFCHKTTYPDLENDDTGEYTPGGKELLCAGSINWQQERGLSSNLQRIMERIDAIRKVPDGREEETQTF